jgi:hypothetical protein
MEGFKKLPKMSNGGLPPKPPGQIMPAPVRPFNPMSPPKKEGVRGSGKTLSELMGLDKKKEGGSAKPGLYANIAAKRERIEKGSGEKMRQPGQKGAPTAKAFKESAKTAKK